LKWRDVASVKIKLKVPLHSTTVDSILRRLTEALFQMFGFFLDWLRTSLYW